MWWDVQDGHRKLTMWAGPQSWIFPVGLISTVHSRINYFRNITCWSCQEPGSWRWRKDIQIGMEEPSETDGNRTQQCALVIDSYMPACACVCTHNCVQTLVFPSSVHWKAQEVKTSSQQRAHQRRLCRCSLLGQSAYSRASSLGSTHKPKQLISENEEGLKKRGVSQDTADSLMGLQLPSLWQCAHEQNWIQY